MDLRQLKVFAEIVRQGNFTRAAESLHIAQPAVSMTIRKLEEELDLVLLNRQEKQVTLTVEGETLLKHAERILDDVYIAATEMTELKELVRGEVRIGIPPMMSAYYFPRIIGAFRTRYPELRLSVNGEGAGRIQNMIARGELDMGVVANPDKVDGIAYQHFLREEIVACVPEDHPFAGKNSITIHEFLRQPLILFKEGYHMREVIDDLLAREQLQPNIVFETNLYTLVRNLINQRLGISTFLRMAVSHDPELAVLSFDPPLFIDLFIAWKSQRYLSRANRAFIDVLLSEAEKYPAAGGSDKNSHQADEDQH